MQSLSLSSAVRRLAIAVGVYLVANVILAFAILRPAPAAETPPAVAAAPTAPTPPAAESLLSDPQDWQPVGGAWVFADGVVSQTDSSGFDYAYLAAAQSAEGQIIAVRFRHVEGVGGGLVFNVPGRDALTGGHLVRYLDANTLIWGYFDAAQGFTAQGTFAVPDPGSLAHTLSVTLSEGSYAIMLDGLPIAEGVPLITRQGYHGLTVSQAQAIFESFTVRPS